MDGSPFPTAKDEFRTISVGTTPFDANILNELAATVAAIQMAIGVDPADYSQWYGASGNFLTVAEALKARFRFDVFTYTQAAGTGSQVVNFPNARFTSAPQVYLMPTYSGRTTDWNYHFHPRLVSTTQFTSVRFTAAAYTPVAVDVKALAIQLP